MHWMILPLRRYAEFRGRSPRVEFWMFQLFLLIAFVVTVWLDTVLPTGGERIVRYETAPGLWSYAVENSGGWITGLFGLAMLIPWFALAVRRLHDLGRSGLWLLLLLVPLFGSLALLVFFLTDSQRGPNRYGPDPKEPVAAPAALG